MSHRLAVQREVFVHGVREYRHIVVELTDLDIFPELEVEELPLRVLHHRLELVLVDARDAVWAGNDAGLVGQP